MPALTTQHIMHYMNLIQPHEICNFLGQIEKEEWPDPGKTHWSQNRGSHDICRDWHRNGLPPEDTDLSARNTWIRSEGTQPHRRGSKCMITREEAQAKFREYRDAQGPHDEVYTDGSKIDKWVGAAAVNNRHFQSGETTCRQLSKRLPNNSTIFAA